jgi:LacI family transcriptional regulator
MIKPTLKDIAEYVGVSVSTVSKALSNSKEINEETIKKVMDAAVMFNYKNMAAENSVTSAIGVILPEVTSFLHSNILEKLELKLQDSKYNLLLGIHNFEYSKVEKYVKLFTAKKLNGIIIVVDSCDISDEQYEKIISVCNANKIPLLVIESSTNRDFNSHCNAIMIDDYHAIETLTDQLIQNGHREFGLIFDRLDYNRLETVKAVLQKKGIELPEHRIYITDKRNQIAGVEGMNYFLEKKDFPTAFVASYDEICIGALKCAQDFGFKAPEDFSIFSFDNIRISEYVFNGITTIQIPIHKVADIAVSTIMNEIVNGIDKSKTITRITSKAVIRNTTGPVPDRKR